MDTSYEDIWGDVTGKYVDKLQGNMGNILGTWGGMKRKWRDKELAHIGIMDMRTNYLGPNFNDISSPLQLENGNKLLWSCFKWIFGTELCYI